MTQFLDSYYRPDIQGLRGVAVLLVVFYHSGVGFSGGYVGVDVFFVVSGYVITLLLLREYGSGQPRVIRRFYKRRILRLLPAASVAVFSVVLLSMLALSPTNEISQVTELARSTTKFVANFKLLEEPGYFSLLNPLQHMWSLAVEEQFYLLFPVGLFIFLKCFRRSPHVTTFILVSLIGVSLLSFFGSVVLTYGRGSQLIAERFQTTPQNFAFYMMPSRMWEFCVGACLAIIPQTVNSRFARLRKPMVTVGALAVLYAAIVFDSHTPFPGLAALVPVLGTASIVRSARYSRSIYALLTSRIMSFLGDISYSWYLWHWPAIVFVMALVPNSKFAVLVAVILSLGPAIWSYRFVEYRFRTKTNYSNWKFFALVSACILVPIITAFVVETASARLENRTPEMIAVKDRRFSSINGCNNAGVVIAEKCLVMQEDSLGSAVLFGDSHASSASDGVVIASSSSRLSLGIATFSGCPPFLVIPAGDGCQGVRSIYEQILQDLDPEIVVVVNSLQHYAPSDLSSIGLTTPFVVESEIEYIRSLVEDGRHVVVVLEVPTMDIQGQASLLRPHLKTSITQLSNQVWRNWLIARLRIGLSDFADVSVIETDNIFFPNDSCNPRASGTLIYSDSTHLNPEGSIRLVESLQDAFQTQLQKMGVNQ